MIDNVISAKNITKSFQDGHLYVDVLKELNLSVKAGEKIAIVGTSGSGKSTLLHILGGLDRPSAGTVNLLNSNFSDLSDNKKASLRNENLGFIYQFHHLLPEFTALENVAMPLLINSTIKVSQAKILAKNYLQKVGLSNREQHKPAELSGGERQRVAIARALVSNPKCVLADEPTGNLDEDNADKIYDLIASLSKELKTSFIIVTHDINLANKMDCIYHLTKGVLAKN